MKKLLLGLFVLFVSSNTYSQSKWDKINLPTSEKIIKTYYDSIENIGYGISYFGALYKYDIQQSTWSVFLPDTANVTVVEYDSFNVYIGTQYNGLLVFNKKNLQFTDTILSGVPISVIESSLWGKIYFAQSTTGLFSYNLDSKTYDTIAYPNLNVSALYINSSYSMLAGVYNSDLNKGYVCVSKDFGKTWKQKYTTKKILCFIESPTLLNIASTENGLYSSNPDLDKWIPWNGYNLKQMEFDKKINLYGIRYSSLVYSEDRGAHFDVLFSVSGLNSFSLINDTQMVVSTAYNSYLFSINSKEATLINDGFGRPMTINNFDFDKNGNIYASFYNSGLYKSSDDGLNWEKFWPIKSIDNDFRTIIVFNDSNVYVVDYRNLLKWNNESKSLEKKIEIDYNAKIWQDKSGTIFILDDDLNIYSDSLNKITSVFEVYSGERFINYDTTYFISFGYDGYRISKNGGKSWSSFHLGTQFNSVVHFSNCVFMASSYKDLYISYDTGFSWQVFPNSPGTYTSNLFLTDYDELYLLSENQIYKSKDYGYNWKDISPDFDVFPNILRFNTDKRGYIYFYHPKIGLYKCSEKINNIRPQKPDILNEISIYPNPTKNYFKIQNIQKSLLSIYDINGRIVKEEIIENGSVINVENFDKGIYLVKIESGIQVFYSKFVIQ